MRELEREPPASTAPARPPLPERVLIVGAGRAGGSLARAARGAGFDVKTLARGETPEAGAARGAIVLLCVPDARIEAACRATAGLGAAFVGHVSGASSLAALDAAAAAGARVFSLHPLQTIPTPQTDLVGSPCAVAGGDPEAVRVARELAVRLGLVPFAIPEEGRAAYHAAAALASNYLVALEEAAAGLLAELGVERPREVLAPLVLRTAANWADAGSAALTGPIARGDEATVRRHVEALRERAPELLPLYEQLAAQARTLRDEAGGGGS